MVFVLAYSRKKSTLLDFRTFDDEERKQANDLYAALLKRYIDAEGGNIEVNIFESLDQSTFRETHARYFQTTADAIISLRQAL